MKNQAIKSEIKPDQPNRALGIYILSITFFVTAFTLITAAQYL